MGSGEKSVRRPLVALSRRHLLSAKCVLVTGAGGSVGSELCHQIAAAGPSAIVLLDRYESHLHAISTELADTTSSVRLIPALADITDAPRLEQLFAAHRPDVVFHAAAHKHVPLMEDHPCEAVKNNVRGTRLLVDAAVRWHTDRFVLISTDKAVQPTSVMGATKRVAERIVQAAHATTTRRFVTVRFGNVLASNGSVVPRFLAQIEAGGPVTVTHPEMRRYFLQCPEAVRLVLQAAALDAGVLYVLEMGEPVRVADLARDLIRLAGFTPDQDIQIVYTGIRPGEKLDEQLVDRDEIAAASGVAHVRSVRPTAPVRSESLLAEIARLERLALEGDAPQVLDGLRQLVPSFSSSLSAASSPASSPALSRALSPALSRADEASARLRREQPA